MFEPHKLHHHWTLVCCVCSEQRLLKAVKQHATRGDPQSVISAIDHFCRHREWAMNVGDEKGQGTDSIQDSNHCFNVFRTEYERNNNNKRSVSHLV